MNLADATAADQLFEHELHRILNGGSLADQLFSLFQHEEITMHLGRPLSEVYFDPENHEPLCAPSEQRIYNLLRRGADEALHIPFRSVQPNKQTADGDIACIKTYPPDCETLRYNSGNHFMSRPANGNVFEEHSARCRSKSRSNLHVLFKRGFMTDRLEEVKTLTAASQAEGRRELQYFVICSRHSQQEGHYGVALVVMDPANLLFPRRVLISDTLLKDLPKHPRWWPHFVSGFSQVFGEGVTESLEDLSHPLQKVNIFGDAPYNHDWDCPYYAAAMADALAELAGQDPQFMIRASAPEIHEAMKQAMPDYYEDGAIKDRAAIRLVNRAKRWESGQRVILLLSAGVGNEVAQL